MSQSRREVLRRQQEAQAKSKRLNRIVAAAAIVIGLVLVAVFAVVLAQSWGKGTSTAAGAPPNATASANGIVVNPGKGSDTTPTVELFLDYQCPVCKQFETLHGATLKSLADSGQIKLVYRTMTFLDNNLRNDASLRAAVGAACSDNVGSYSAYHDAVFARQPATEGDGYATELLRTTIPTGIGLTGEKLTTFQQCYDTRATKAFVEGTNEAAARDGVSATPTMRVNGKTLDNKTLFTATAEGLTKLLLAG